MSEESLNDSKQKIRKSICELLRNQKEEHRLEKSLKISSKLFAAEEFKNAKAVLFYVSFDGEVETRDMIKQAMKMEKKVALPRILKEERQIVPILVENLQEDLVPGAYGIPEPKYDEKCILDINDIGLSVVPGVAFDRNNFRLGRGAGYYDRFLSRLPRSIPSIGLAFDFQIVDRLPQEPHDVPVSRVIVN